MALVAFALAGCNAADPVANQPSGAQKIATYDGGEITQGELQEQLDTFAQQSGAGKISSDSPQYQAAVSQVMPQLIGLEMAKAYAKDHNITVSEKDVDKEISKIKDQISQQAQSQGQNLGKEEAFKQALKGANLTESQLRNDIRENLPVQKVQEKVAGDAKASDKDVKKYYDQNKESQFTTPAQRCVRHILLNKDQKQKAEDVKKQLENGGDWKKLAKEDSQDPGSADKGGDLGCQAKGAYVPEFEDAVFKAKKGEIVGPVKTQFGYHVIQVTDIKSERVAPLKEVSSGIKDQLSQEEQSKEFQKWIEDQQKKRHLKFVNGYGPNSAPKSGAGGETTGG